MEKISLAALAVLILALPARGGEFKTDAGGDRYKIAQCKLIVDGKAYINGPCLFLPTGDGSFNILERGMLHRDTGIFAIVNLDKERGTAEGSWNEDPKSAHAESYLGALSRSPGGCWVNERATICAK